MDFVMEAVVVEQAGYGSALLGLAKNKKQDKFLESAVIKNMRSVATKLAPLDGGHNKFLESFVLWIDVRAPRYWWQEADTYRIGSTKQSESTMHTLVSEARAGINMDAFEPGSVTPEQKQAMEDALELEDATERLVQLKKLLPEGFLQSRMWCINYKTLRNIYHQRKHHRLPHWQKFLSDVLSQISEPGWITSGGTR